MAWILPYHLPFDRPLEYGGYERVIVQDGFRRQTAAGSLIHPRFSKLLVEIKQVVRL